MFSCSSLFRFYRHGSSVSQTGYAKDHSRLGWVDLEADLGQVADAGDGVGVEGRLENRAGPLIEP